MTPDQWAAYNEADEAQVAELKDRLAPWRTEARVVTLTEFLLARIAEDEAVARDVATERARVGEAIDYPAEADFSFWADYDGASPSVSVGAHRALTECEAKRQIVASFSEFVGPLRAARLQETKILRALATVYAGHPEFRKEWQV